MAGFDYNRGHTSTSSVTSYGKSNVEKAAIVHSVITSFDDIPDNTLNLNDKRYVEIEANDYITKNANIYGGIRFKFPSGVELNENNFKKMFSKYLTDSQIYLIFVKQFGNNRKEFFEKYYLSIRMLMMIPSG